MRRVCRWTIYSVGMVVLALGITLNTKAGLGVSPVVSVAYSLSQIFGLDFGNMTFVAYSMFVAAQFLVRGRGSRVIDLLQLPLSLVFSWVLSVLGRAVTYDCTAYGVGADLAVLLGGVVLTGTGIVLTLNMRLIPNPGDGIIQAVEDRTGWSQGFSKNVCDISCVCITLMLGLVLHGRVIGIGLGTVVAMVATGRVVALLNRLFKEKMCRAAGVAQGVNGNVLSSSGR